MPAKTANQTAGRAHSPTARPNAVYGSTHSSAAPPAVNRQTDSDARVRTNGSLGLRSRCATSVCVRMDATNQPVRKSMANCSCPAPSSAPYAPRTPRGCAPWSPPRAECSPPSAKEPSSSFLLPCCTSFLAESERGSRSVILRMRKHAPAAFDCRSLRPFRMSSLYFFAKQKPARQTARGHSSRRKLPFEL